MALPKDQELAFTTRFLSQAFAVAKGAETSDHAQFRETLWAKGFLGLPTRFLFGRHQVDDCLGDKLRPALSGPGHVAAQGDPGPGLADRALAARRGGRFAAFGAVWQLVVGS